MQLNTKQFLYYQEIFSKSVLRMFLRIRYVL